MMTYFLSKVSEKRVEILTSILLFTVLFNNKIGNIVLSLLVLVIFLDKKKYQFKFTNKIKIIIIFFLFLVIRELFNLEKQGIDYIVRLLPILILFISLGRYNFKKNQIKLIGKSIIVINYIFYTHALFLGTYLYVINSLNNKVLNFSYYQWVVPIKTNFHPPYWGLFIVLSFVFVLRSSVIENKTKFIFGVFSFIFLFFLSTRAAILSITVVVVLELIFNKSTKTSTKYFIFIPFILSIIILSLSSPYLSKKVKDNSGVQQRIKLWEATADALKENYLFGNSVAKADVLVKHFYDLRNESKDNYDPHNQFLFFAVNYGLLGLFLFLIILIYNENYNLSFIMFMFVVIISFTTESVLNRQMGTVMFGVFFSLISNRSYRKEML